MDFGEVISVYTEDDAIADGVLVHPYPKEWPWLLITTAVHAVCSEQKGRTYDQCLIPLLNDCILAVKSTKKEPPIILEHTVAGTIWIMPNGKGGMTVMLPSDY